MATTLALDELLKRYKMNVQEMALLRESQKELLAEFKNQVSPEAFKAAFAVFKKKAKLKPEVKDEYDQILDFLETNLSIEYID